jgi:predicted GTPase
VGPRRRGPRLDLDRELDRLLSFAAWAPRVNVSAHSGRGIRRLLPQLLTIWDNYGRRVPRVSSTSLLADATAARSAASGQKQLRIRYATQPEVRPPRFVLFSNGSLPDGYLRYLERTCAGALRLHRGPAAARRPAARRARTSPLRDPVGRSGASG